MIQKKFLPLPWYSRLKWQLLAIWYHLRGRGMWIWNVGEGTLWWDRQNCKVFGIDCPHGLEHNYDSFAAMLWDDIDRTTVTRDVALAQYDGSVYYSAFRAMEQSTGDSLVIRAVGWTIKGRNGHPHLMIGWNSRLPYTREKVAQIIVRQVAMDKLSRKSCCRGTSLMACFIDNYANR